MKLHYKTIDLKKRGLIDKNDYTQIDSQYETCSFTNEHNDVDAIYIERTNPILKGNILAAALPEKPSINNIIIYSRKNIILNSYEDEIVKPIDEQIQDLINLQYVRIPLPHQFELAKQVSDAFTDAAVSRYIEFIPTQNILIHTNGFDQVEHLVSFSEDGGTNGNAILVGASGTGKSSSLISALNYYPQVIRHRSEEVPLFTQVSYIYIECPQNGNLNGLYDNIAKAYDKALKNLDDYYYQKCIKIRRLNEKQSFIRSLINKHHTLLLAIDEVQNMNFERNKESSFYTLLNLKNETKVSMIFAGLESAIDCLLTDYAMQRRAKHKIDLNNEIFDKSLFERVIRELFTLYQWFNPRIDLDNMKEDELLSILELMYTYTHGIIDQVIALYQAMNYEAIISKQTINFNEEFIINVNNKHFPGILSLLKDIENNAQSQKLRAIKIKNNMNELLSAHSELISQKQSENNTAINKIDIIKRCNKVVLIIKDIFPNLEDEFLSESFYRLNKKYPNLDDTKLCQEIIKMIMNKKTKSSQKNTKNDNSKKDYDNLLSNNNQFIEQGRLL